MKKSIAVLIIALASIQVAFSQQVFVATSLEKVINGIEYGTGIYYKNRAAFSCGVFYQTSFAGKTESYRSINPFYGLRASAPLAKSDRLTFSANVRVGFVNKNFLICAPGLETDIRLLRKVSLGVGMSVRKGAMSANTNLKFSL